jgi:D-sedoheptulose 7-phosphate isomerase
MDAPPDSFSLTAYIDHEWQEHRQVAAETLSVVAAPLQQLVQAAAAAVRNGGKIIFFGNGGSAADAQHLATELAVRYSQNRPAIAALALTTDTSALTAIGNDYAFEDIFSRQVEALCREEDVVIGISTSGNSGNVLKALATARQLGATTVAFTGGSGGKLANSEHLLLCVPSPVTARIQEMHITIGQIFCGALERQLGLVSYS